MPETPHSPRIIESFIPLVHFLGAFLGSQCEVVLHDTASKEKSVLAIANSHITGRTVGAPLTDLALTFVVNREYDHKDWVMGYTTRSKDNRPLHSATYFIREQTGDLAGMLCLNMDVSDLKNARDLINRVVQALGLDDAAAKGEDAHTETFSDSLEDLTENLIVQVIEGAAITPERMTAAERIEIVRTLNAKGVFLLKGTVGLVAARLAASEATIYRYLQKINE